MELQYKTLPYLEPQIFFTAIVNKTDVVFLDSSFKHEHYGRYSFIAFNPIAKYQADIRSFNYDLQILNKILGANSYDYDPNLPPFTGGFIGYFSYDLNKQLEQIPSTKTIHVANYVLGLYNQVVAFDNIKKICYLLVSKVIGFDLDYVRQLSDLENLYYKISNSNTEIDSIYPKQFGFQLNTPLKSNFTQTQYQRIVKKAINYIKAGDIFEVNLAQCFKATVAKNYPAHLLYQKLRNINKAPFSVYFDLGTIKILSSSPERFIMRKGNKIETRPIKGTIQRSNNPDLDSKLAYQLQNSIKDKAENIMIVDLMRNDLSKICKPKTVQVTKLCGAESFDNIHHLVSVIEGELKSNINSFDILPAVFPGGSITGAPKIRAMEIIEELERCSRGIYCGSIGYFGFNGNVDLSITIRTIVINGEELSFQVGGAITLDSDPLAEYQETMLKATKLSEAINDFSN